MNKRDDIAIIRSLQTIFLMGVAVSLSFFAIRSKNPVLIFLVPIIPLAIWLLGNPSFLLLTMLIVSSAKLTPGIPGELTVAHLLQLAIIGWAIINTALRKERFRRKDIPGRFLMLFFLNLLLIVAVRGFGLSFVGGSTYGGAAYIYLGISLLSYFAASRISLNEKQLKILFFWGFLAALIPFFVQLSFYMTGGATAFLTNFVRTSVRAIAFAALEQDASATRWSELSNVSLTLLTVTLVVPAIGRKTTVFWCLIGISAMLMMLTGYRSRIVGLGMVLFMWLLYESKNRRQMVFAFLALGILGYAAALAVMPVLPGAVQRTLSFLPFAAERITDRSIFLGAEGSTDFRFKIWRIALAEVPKYLLIGRGLTLDITRWAWLSADWYVSPEFNYDSHAYHSGPLGLLVDTGLLGLFSAAGFMISVCVKGWQGVRRFCKGRNDLISRYYAFLVIQFTYSVVSYFLVFGDIRETIPVLVINAVLIRIIYRELEKREPFEGVDLFEKQRVNGGVTNNLFNGRL